MSFKPKDATAFRLPSATLQQGPCARSSEGLARRCPSPTSLLGEDSVPKGRGGSQRPCSLQGSHRVLTAGPSVRGASGQIPTEVKQALAPSAPRAPGAAKRGGQDRAPPPPPPEAKQGANPTATPGRLPGTHPSGIAGETAVLSQTPLLAGPPWAFGGRSTPLGGRRFSVALPEAESDGLVRRAGPRMRAPDEGAR